MPATASGTSEVKSRCHFHALIQSKPFRPVTSLRAVKPARLPRSPTEIVPHCFSSNKRISTQDYGDGRKDNSRCKLREPFYS
jgi:hypothetical protein